MMRAFLCLLLSSVLFSVSAEVLYRDVAQFEAVVLLQSDAGGSTVQFNLTDLEVIDTNFRSFGSANAFRIPSGGAFLGEIGSPDLPVVRKMVLVPAHGDITIDIVSKETSPLGNYTVSPWQEPATWSGPEPGFRINDDVYRSSAYFPGSPVEIEHVDILRDIRVAWVRYNPVQVNPVTGEALLTKSVTVRISAGDHDGENELNRVATGYTSSFLPIYRQVVGFQEDRDAVSGSYVFIGTTESLGLAQELINWKKQKGYDVRTGDLATIGTTVSEIDAWLENAFNNWSNPPEYVLLVGDNYVVPSPQYTGDEVHAADNQYAVVGSSVLPSMHIGRISGNDSDDLAYISWKIKKAELTPYQPSSGSWFNSAFSMACTNPMNAAYESRMLHQLFIANGLESTFYCNALGGTNPSLANVVADINSGVAVVNYIGHGNITSWVTSGFSISNIATLTNGRMMPWVFTVGCQNGEFDGHYCFTEAFLSEGTVSTPRGAVNIMGSSTFTPIGPGDTLQVHTFRGYFTKNIHHLGAAHSFGKAGCYTSFGSSGVDMVNIAHVFGCPETDIFTDTSPVSVLTNTHSPTVTAGSFQVAVTDGADAPVAGALVGVYYEDTKELLDGAYTNASGIARLTIPTLPGANTVTITSTAHNRLPAVTYANCVGTQGEESASLPAFYLSGVYPNPVTSTASIGYSTSTAGMTDLAVFDITGRKVTTIQSDNVEAGIHSVTWNGTGVHGRPVPDGLYFITLTTPAGTRTQSFVILR
jgi:gingipain R